VLVVALQVQPGAVPDAKNIDNNLACYTQEAIILLLLLCETFPDSSISKRRVF